MNSQAKICRTIIDFKDIVTNQVFTDILVTLRENNISQEAQKIIFNNVQIAIGRNLDNLVDLVIKETE